MPKIIIEFGDDVPCGLDVVNEHGERCNGLCFGEMLEQVVSLTHPGLPRIGGAYRMQTAEKWAAERSERCARFSANSNPPKDPDDFTDSPF